MSAGRAGRKTHHLPASKPLLTLGCANNHCAVEDDKPLLFVLIVVGAHGLAGRQLEDLDDERLAPRLLADPRNTRAVTGGIGRVKLAISAEHVPPPHHAIITLPGSSTPRGDH